VGRRTVKNLAELVVDTQETGVDREEKVEAAVETLALLREVEQVDTPETVETVNQIEIQ
jgi:hypothetical protein